MKRKYGIIFRFVFYFILQISIYDLFAQNDVLVIKKKVSILEKSVDLDCKKGTSLNSYLQMLPRIELENKTKVFVFAKDSIIRKMSILADDESFADPYIHYYFDSRGYLVSSLYHGADSSINHEIYLHKRIISSIIDKINNFTTDDRNNKNSKYFLAEAKFIVDYYLSNFNNIRYSTYDITDNEAFTLITYKTLFLREKPDISSGIIKKLPPNTELFYLDRSYNQDSFAGKEKWIWYKVKLSDNVIGWVWGHPSLIGENVEY